MTNASELQKAIRRFKAAGAGLCLLTMAGTANAAFIDVTGTVTNGGVDGNAAPSEPFSSGDLLTGSIEINDGAATAGSSFNTEDLLGFDLDVGPANFTSGNAAPVAFFGGSVSDDGTALSGLEFTTNLAAENVSGCGTCGLLLSSDDSAFVVSGDADNPAIAGGFDFSANVREQTASVPEPSSVLLFGAGLLGLGLTRLRRG